MKIRIIILISTLILILCLVYTYAYQSHRDIRIENPKFHMSSDSLHHNFSHQQKKANELYINQVLAIEGNVLSFSQQMILLEPGIACMKDSSFVFPAINLGDRVTIKGRCIGYDDLFGEVKMDQSTLY